MNAITSETILKCLAMRVSGMTYEGIADVLSVDEIDLRTAIARNRNLPESEKVTLEKMTFKRRPGRLTSLDRLMAQVTPY